MKLLISGAVVCTLALSPRPGLAQPPPPAPRAAGAGTPDGAGPVAAGPTAPPQAAPVTIERRAESASSGSVRGVVRSKGGEPLAGATISDPASGAAAISEADGGFVLSGVAVGRHQLAVEAVGYGPVTVTVNVAAGAQAQVTATLGEMNLIGEEIVITGLRAPEKRLDSPVNVEVVSEKDIQRTGGGAYLAALANVKGLDFATSGIGDQRISARGFTTQFNSRMLTMLDGRLAQLPGNGLPQGNAPAGHVARHEVDRGRDRPGLRAVRAQRAHRRRQRQHQDPVGPVRRGGGRARRNPTSMFGGAARLAGTIAGDVGWKINAEYLNADDFEPSRTRSMVGADGVRRSPHYYNTDVAPAGGTAVPVFEGDLVRDYKVEGAKADGSLYYRFADDWQAKGSYGFSQSTGVSLTNAGRNHIRDWQVQYQALQVTGDGVFAQVTRTASDAGKTYPLNNLAPMVAAMGGADQVSDQQLEELRDSIQFVNKSQMVDSDLQYHRAFGALKGTVGGQVRSYMPKSEGSYLSDADEEIQSTEMGAYAQLDYSLLDEKLRVVGAGRVDHHSDYGTQLSPSATVVYEVAPLHNVRAGYQRAFKSPTILENYLLINGFLVGNKTGFDIRDGEGETVATIDPLSPESVHQLEVGYKGVISSRLFVEAVVYNSWYREFISALTQQTNPGSMDPAVPATFGYYPDGTIVGEGSAAPGTLFTYVNFGEATVRGTDVGATYLAMDGVELQGSVSYIDLADFSSGDSPQKELLLNVPTFKLKGAVTVSGLGLPGYYVRLGTRYHNAYDFESGYWSTAKFGPVPAGVVTDLGAGYELTGLGVSISATVTNLFNSRDPDVLGVPVPGRFAFLQLGYNFQGLDY